MSTEAMTAAGIACSVFMFAMFVWKVIECHRKDQIIAMKDKRIEGQNEFIERCIAAYYTACGVDVPFVMPNDDDYGPDFDIEKLFAAAEEPTQEDADEETECEEKEQPDAAG